MKLEFSLFGNDLNLIISRICIIHIFTILDTQECVEWHKQKQIDVELHEEMLCAGHQDGRQDACLGDSGGPLIVLENKRWTLVGITSAGFGCGEPNQPGIYHSIPKTVQWITSVVQDDKHLFV